MVVDCTRQPINKNVFDLLIKLAEYHKIQRKFRICSPEKKINLSEGRNVCHTHLRNIPVVIKRVLKLSNFVEKIETVVTLRRL